MQHVYADLSDLILFGRSTVYSCPPPGTTVGFEVTGPLVYSRAIRLACTWMIYELRASRGIRSGAVVMGACLHISYRDGEYPVRWLSFKNPTYHPRVVSYVVCAGHIQHDSARVPGVDLVVT